MFKILNVVAGLLFIVAFVPYILAIVRGQTKPAKVSWIIWATLDSITFAGMCAQNTLNGQIIGAIIGAWTVVILAMKFGTPGWTFKDILYLVGGALGIILWMKFSNPTLAIVTSSLVVFLGAFSTFENAIKYPEQEDKIAWLIFWLSCVAAIIAIPKWNFDNAAQPVTFTVIETTMMYLLWLRPRTAVTKPSVTTSAE